MADALMIDEAQMYVGMDYKVSEKITIHSPSVLAIIRFGEQEYFNAVHALTCIPSDMKYMLFKQGVDYEKISDYDLFLSLANALPQHSTSLLFGDLDFSVMKRYRDLETGDECLCDLDKEIKIDKLAYAKISTYLRRMHDIHPKVEHAASKIVKQILIEEDQARIEKMEKEGYKSTFRPLLSAMMRYPGFKYKTDELDRCSIFEFMDTVKGSQIYVTTNALIHGSYSGMIDTSKIPKKSFNWMRDIDD